MTFILFHTLKSIHLPIYFKPFVLAGVAILIYLKEVLLGLEDYYYDDVGN